MIWGLFALFAGLFYCVQSEINKTYQVSGFRLNTFRAAFSSLLMIPFIPLMEWPALPVFYLVIILEAAISVVCMMAQYNLAAKKSGRVACLHQPICIMLTFAFWLAIDPEQRAYLTSNPEIVIGILVAFTMFFFSIQFIRKNDAGWQALLSVIPIAVLYSIMMVISKIALEYGDDLLGISLTFVFLTNVFMFLISIPVFISNNIAAPGGGMATN